MRVNEVQDTSLVSVMSLQWALQEYQNINFFAWRRRGQRSPGWRINCHFLVTEVFIPVTCKAFLPASFTSHLLCCEGSEPNCLLKKTTFVVILPARRAMTAAERSILCLWTPFTPTPNSCTTVAHPQDTTCCRPQGMWAAVNISAQFFVPWKCSNKSPK